MSAVPTMASEAPADGPSLSAAEAWSIEHEAPLHSCPSCTRTTPNGGVCDDCAAAPDDCVNCGAAISHDHQGVCDICDPGPTLAEIADSRVSPEVIRAALDAEREEIAAALDRLAVSLDTPHDACAVEMAARNVRARGLVRLG